MSEKDVEVLKKKVDLILFYINNDEGTGRKGIVNQLEDLKDKVDKFIVKYNQNEAVKKAKMTIWGMIGGAVIWLFKILIEKFLPHL